MISRQSSKHSSASQSHFAFRVRGIPDETFAVAEFTGSEHALSEDFLFAVTLRSEGVIEPAHAVGQRGVFELGWSNPAVFVHGVVRDFNFAGETPAGYEYIASLTSPLFPLKLAQHNRVFLNKTVTQVVEEVLLGVGLQADDFSFVTRQQYPLREYCVQYDETDYDFLQRIIAHYGLFFRFASDREKSRIVFHDAGEDLPALSGGELLYQEQSGTNRGLETIFAFRPRGQMLSARVQLRDYNYRTPQFPLEVNASQTGKAGGDGDDRRFGENFKNPDEGQLLARVRQQAHDCQRETFVAESDCQGIVPGCHLRMSGHPAAELNGEYLVVEVEHQGEQGSGAAYAGNRQGMTYRNKLLMLRAGVAYRKPLPQRRVVNATFSARVETTGGEYAYLDTEGRYRVRVDFDYGDAAEGQASHAVRLLQPYGGDLYGQHFPLHAGTEVAMTCINGDLDRPILLGVLPNPDSASPVSTANPTQNILRTWGGNQLIMDDQRGKERIDLFTLERKNILTLDADSAGHAVRLATEEGEMEVYAKKELRLESGDTQTLQSGNDHLVRVENAQRLMSKNQQLQMQAATDIQMQAGEHILYLAENGDLTQSAAGNMLTEVGQSQSIEVKGQNLDILVEQGGINIQAARALTVKGRGGGTLHIGQGSGAIEINSAGDLTLATPSLCINAALINIKAGSIGNN